MQKKLSGIHRRINSIKYGMFYWNNKNYKIPVDVKINGKSRKLKTESMDIIEFTGICINDCYRLQYLKKNLDSVNTIADVGANQGMFVIAARQNFPQAEIHCYEPNPFLIDTLSFNAKQLQATPYFEAIMQHDCKVNLHFTASDLATTASESGNGNVTGSSLATVIKRIGDIDILKLDCEGAEWGLLEDTNSWKHVKSLTMEYHLWGKKGAKVESLFQLLSAINFKLVHHNVCNSHQGLVVAINKIFLKNHE